MTVLNADCDFRSLLKPSALFRYVEQVSADHARAYGMDDPFFRERHGARFWWASRPCNFTGCPAVPKADPDHPAAGQQKAR